MSRSQQESGLPSPYHDCAVPNVVFRWEREHKNHKCKLIKIHAGVFAELSNITTVHQTPSDGESIVVFVTLRSCCIHWKRRRWHSVPKDSHCHLQVHTPACRKYMSNRSEAQTCMFKKFLNAGSAVV